MASQWYVFCRWLTKVFFIGPRGGLRSVGAENVPLSGALIVAPVHLSHLDPPAVACGTKRPLRFMAKEELFKVKVLGPLIRSLGAFPVKRGEGDTESIRYAMSCLEKGEAVLIFPEGTRGDGDTLLPINRGIAMIAKRTGAKVMPVGIVGTNVILPKGGAKKGKHLVTIVYGKPFTYDEACTGASEKENREIFAARLASEMVSLSQSAGSKLSLPS